jgi:hypothetical protein
MPSSSLAYRPPNPAALAGIAQRTAHILPHRFTPQSAHASHANSLKARKRNAQLRRLKLALEVTTSPKVWKPRLGIKHIAPLLQGAIDKVRELEARLDATMNDKDYRRLKLASYLGPETVPPKGKGTTTKSVMPISSVVSDGSSTPETSPRMLEPIGPAPRK